MVNVSLCLFCILRLNLVLKSNGLFLCYLPEQLLSDFMFLLPSFKCFHLFCVFFFFFLFPSILSVPFILPGHSGMMCGNAFLEMFRFCPWINLEILKCDASLKICFYSAFQQIKRKFNP